MSFEWNENLRIRLAEVGFEVLMHKPFICKMSIYDICFKFNSRQGGKQMFYYKNKY